MVKIKKMWLAYKTMTLKQAFYLFLVITGICGIFWIFPFGVVYNSTPSLPLGFYWYKRNPLLNENQRRAHVFKQDEIVVFSLLNVNYPSDKLSQYLGYGSTVIKKVGAQNGFLWTDLNKDTWLCNKPVYNGDPKKCTHMTKALNMDSKNRPLVFTTYQNMKIKEDEVFIYSNYSEKSFDSRYWGLLKKEYIWGYEAKPLFTWN